MKKLMTTIFLSTIILLCHSQIKWKEAIPKGSEFSFENYSTTFLGDIDSKTPFLVAAIPYNGAYNNFEQSNAPLDLSFTGSLYSFKSPLANKRLSLYTYDSGNVYFLVFNLTNLDIKEYEYRILHDGKSVIKPWTDITDMTNIDINNFDQAAILGGYQTSWGHFISAELRHKNSDSILAITQISWKETKPRVTGVYYSKNLQDFFTSLKRPWDKKEGLTPDSMVFKYPEHTIILNLRDEIFKKEALEYQLSKDGKPIRPWGPNDHDDSFIWLKDLPPGKYTIEIRYSKQRHNPNTYHFEIIPQFQQTLLFKTITGSLMAAFFGFFLLLYISNRQKQKLKSSQQDREKLALKLQSVHSRLNPHFIFNALGSIQALVNGNKNEKANEYLVSFSSLLRQSLQLNDKEFVSVTEESKMIEKYLYIEQLRFHFSYTVQVYPEAKDIELPAFLIQPLVENAVKHGVSLKQEAGHIDIRFKKVYQQLVIEIEDNGAGFDKDDYKEGHGLRLVRERIALLNHAQPGKKMTLEIESKIGNGTKIIISFNFTA